MDRFSISKIPDDSNFYSYFPYVSSNPFHRLQEIILTGIFESHPWNKRTLRLLYPLYVDRISPQFRSADINIFYLIFLVPIVISNRVRIHQAQFRFSLRIIYPVIMQKSSRTANNISACQTCNRIVVIGCGQYHRICPGFFFDKPAGFHTGCRI